MLFKHFFAMLLLAGLLPASAQSDQAISTHNYKHANKAMKAREGAAERAKVVEVRQASRKEIKPAATPRYRIERPSLIISTPYQGDTHTINPLRSAHYYKASVRPDGF